MNGSGSLGGTESPPSVADEQPAVAETGEVVGERLAAAALQQLERDRHPHDHHGQRAAGERRRRVLRHRRNRSDDQYGERGGGARSGPGKPPGAGTGARGA